MTDNTDNLQLGQKPWQFSKGNSGNPAGRPQGSRNKATLAAQALLAGELEAITRKVIELAKNGDMTALRLIVERMLPIRKDSPITVDLPPITTAQDTVKASVAILQAVSCGDITPNEGQILMAMVERLCRSIETQELERRIIQLEQSQAEG